MHGSYGWGGLLSCIVESAASQSRSVILCQKRRPQKLETIFLPFFDFTLEDCFNFLWPFQNVWIYQPIFSCAAICLWLKTFYPTSCNLPTLNNCIRFAGHHNLPELQSCATTNALENMISYSPYISTKCLEVFFRIILALMVIVEQPLFF